MIGFKNWLNLAENQIDRTIQTAFPGVPRWVRNDLFKNNWLKRDVRSGATKTPFSDWLNKPGVQAFKNVRWPTRPVCFDIHPNDLSEDTLSSLMMRRFGRKSINTKTFDAETDAAKTDAQCKLMGSINGSCNHVPIILVRQQDNKLKMIEGWHRLMCRLLDGCPQDKLPLLDDESYTNWKLWEALDLNNWKRVKINAFVGIEASAPVNQQGRTPQNYNSPTGPWIPSDGQQQAAQEPEPQFSQN